MSKLARKATEWAEHRQSRRGFLATCGKVTLALGLAIAGLSGMKRTAFAACCPSPNCNTSHSYPCPPGPGCPAGCQQGFPTQCCDASGFWHNCWPCTCGGVDCYCEEITPDPC